MMPFHFLHLKSLDSIFYNPHPRMTYFYKHTPFTGDVKVSDYTQASFEDGELTKIYNSKGTLILRLYKTTSWTTCIMVSTVLVGVEQAIKTGILSKEKLLYYKLKGDL